MSHKQQLAKVLQLHCNRCQHTWARRTVADPKQCPACKSRQWNKERQREIAPERHAKLRQDPQTARTTVASRSMQDGPLRGINLLEVVEDEEQAAELFRRILRSVRAAKARRLAHEQAAETAGKAEGTAAGSDLRKQPASSDTRRQAGSGSVPKNSTGGRGRGRGAAGKGAKR